MRQEPEYRERDRSPPLNHVSDDDVEPRAQEGEHAAADHGWWNLFATAYGDDVHPNDYVREPSPGDDNPPTIAEVLVSVLDWYASHKETYTATRDVFSLFATIVPPGTRVGTFQQMQEVLQKHNVETCEVYDACPHGCCVYKDYDTRGPFATLQYANISKCPYCGAPRFAGYASVWVLHIIRIYSRY